MSPTLTESDINNKLCLPKDVISVKRGARLFAKGTCRYVYHGYYTDTHAHIVLKEYKIV